MNEVIEMPRKEIAGLAAAETHRFSVQEIRQRVNLVQEVMRSIMKEGTHYGTIPGTPKPTLYKPGAEVLCVTFRVAPSYRVEDLSTSDVARYRVTCVGKHQTTDIVLGEGMGECSSGEEKYKWRRSICAEEFDLTPETMRRLKFQKYKGNVEKVPQIRTEQADLSNTALKMACKRAMIAMTLNVTAASDIFTQDIEDLPEELRQHEGGEQVTDPGILKHWCDLANAATTAEALAKVWTDGLAAIKATNHMPTYDGFKVVVEAKGKALKAPPAAEIPPEMEGLVADLEATADNGIDAFVTAWDGLSQATKDKLQPVYAKIKARAEKAEAPK